MKPNDLTSELRVKFNDDGSIMYIKEYRKDDSGNLLVQFKNKKIKSVSNQKNSKNNGYGIVFHSNETINNIGNYIDGKKRGWFYIFNNKGALTSKREYLIINGNEYMNQWIDYDENGNVDKLTSNYIQLTDKNESTDFGEEYVLGIKLEASFFKQYMITVIGDFQDDFQFKKDGVYDTIKSDNFYSEFKTLKYKKGKNVVRGFVEELRYDEKDAEKVNKRKIYFSHSFLVK